jgi:tryptophan synthase alpha chain
VKLETHLRHQRDAGRSLLAPYITGGLGAGWLDVVRAVVDAGADVVEIGIPFSDPVMDGRTIQEASQRALELGATPAKIVAEAARLDVNVPLVIMTYYNVVAHAGTERFAARLADAGVDGAIVPDLPLDELDGWGDAADAAGVETVLLAAPTTPDDRLRAICNRSRGFVYGVSLLGVTGERSQFADAAAAMGRRCKAATDRPVLLGVGISTAEQAVAAARAADGVIVGSALVRRVLAGGGPDDAARYVAELRAALDDDAGDRRRAP